MKIRMTTISAGPGGVLDAESIVDVPDAQAKDLIATLHAVAVDAHTPVTARWPHGPTSADKGDKAK